MQIGELWVKISARNESFNASMDKVQSTIRTATARAEESSKALLKVVGVAATAAAAAVGVIGVKAIESAANAQAMNAQFEQVFGAVQANAQATVNALGEDFGMLPNRIKPALTSMTSMFKGLGYETEEAMGMAEQAVTLAADAAAFFDKSYEDANGALTSFIKGNYEGGESIGLFGNETQIAAYAADKLGISWKDAGEAQKQLARLEYAQAMQAAAGATGQAARESDGYQNQLGNMKQGWADLMALLGQPLLEPAINAIKTITEHLTAFRDLMASEGLAGALDRIFPDWLEVTIVGIAGALTAAMIPAIIGLKVPLLEAAVAAWSFLAPLAPFLAAGAAIGALAYVIIKNWEPISEFFINLWEGIKTKTTEVWESIKQFLVNWWPYLLGALLGPIGLLVAAIYDNWDAIKQSTIEIWTTIKVWLYELWEGIRTQVAKSWDSIYKTLTNVWDMIKTGFNNLVDSAKNWGRNLIQNLIDGIRDRFEALRDIVSDMASMVSDYLGFSSPTKKGPGRFADRWAPNLVNMFADGIKNSMPALRVSLSDMAAVMPVAIGPAISNANSTSNNYGGNTFHITVGGGSTREQAEGIMRELHRLGVRF